MTQRRFVFGLLMSACLSSVAIAPVFATALAYDETADAKLDLQNALASAGRDGVPVLLVFGANWCPDCRALNQALKSPANSALMAKEFRLVKVNVGNFDRNLDVAAAYGNPIKKGIPAAVVLSADNKVLYATRAGELADARRMSDTGVHDFFSRVTQAALTKP